MKNLIKLLIVFTILLLQGNALASHSKGGYVTYTHLGGNTYHVTMTFFRDCSGITPSASIFMNYSSTSCGLTGNVTLNQTGVINSSSVCAALITNTECDGGAYIGEQQYTYEGDVTLPGNCADWIFNYSECCLPTGVTTLTSSDSQSMYFESTLDNLTVPGNNSPILTAPPMGQVCTGMSNTYNFAAVDPDGDSLSYELVTGMQNITTPVTYNVGYSGTYPMSSAPALAIDPITGDITYNSNAIQEALIAVRIYEWRNGVLIASHLRQWLLTTQVCTNSQPTFGSISNVTGATQTAANVIEVCPGTPVSFQFTTTDPDPATVLVMNAISSYPGATFTTSGTNPVTGTFTWTPTVGFVGTNNIVFSVTDNTCPYPGIDYSTIALTVIQSTYAGPDENYCSSQGPLTLSAIGGSDFNWTVVSGDPTLSCTNCASTVVSPSVTTTYQVVSDLTGTCVNTDQVTITVVPNFTFSTSGDQDLCIPYYSSTAIPLSATPAPAGTYTYSWDDLGSSWTATTQATTFNATTATDVAVTISSSLGCVLSDTLSINATTYDDAPDWTLSASSIDPCTSDPVDLTAAVSYGATCDLYAVQSIAFAPEAGSGTVVTLSDDQLSGALPVGFDFNFYCNTYSNFHISSNGFISFDAGAGSGCCSGQLLPNASAPNNVIAAVWTDLYPPGIGSVEYFTVGTAPNRKLIVNWNDVPYCCNTTSTVKTQIVLHETSNNIDVHTSYVTASGNVKTTGIENANGTLGLAAPGRNATAFDATNESWRFSNSGNEPYLVTWQQPVATPIGTGSPITVSPASTTTYTAVLTDVTGTCLSGTQTITITRDNVAPVPNVTPLLDVSAACSVTSLVAPTATDNCSGLISGTHNATLPITTAGTTVVTWTYTDLNGNSSSQTQNIVINDNSAPVPNSVSLADISAACAVTSLTAPTATDNCAGLITGTSNVTLPISSPGTTVITWIFTDLSGNSSTQLQNVVINDNVAPVADLASLANVNAQCSVTSLTAPTATDNCSGVVTGTHNASLPITTQGTTVVTWTYTDASGNSSTQTQNVVITDNIAPVADLASLTNINAQCSVTSLTAPTATDNCSGVVTGTHNASLPITTQGTTVVTWTYADANGNSSTQTQNVIITDNIAPVADLASLTNINAQCSVTSLTAPTATDNCSGAVTGTHNASLPIATQGTTVVTWTYADANGNSSTQTQNIVITDNIAPVADLASLTNVNAQCSVTSLTAPTATDNCSGVVTGTHNASLPITTQGTTVVTWTYADANGNSSTQTQNIVITDNIAPVADLASLANVNAQCSVTSLTAPTATDNCSGTITGTHNASLPITTQGTTVVTWTYADANGNSSTQTQNIVITDNIAPVADLASLANVNAQCSVTSLTAPTATDNCSGTITGTHNASLPITTQGTTVVTWTYADANGNSSTQTQNIVITDNIAPVADAAVLNDIVEACSVSTLTSPTATDNCSGSIIGTHNLVLPIFGNTMITWTFTDAQGNTSTQNQNIIINDNIAPNVPVLADFDGSCENPVTTPTATDNCNGPVTVTTNDPLVYTSPGTYVINWIFTDGEGNTANGTQNVIVSGSTTYNTIQVTTCGTYTSDNGITYTSSGIYTEVIPNTYGCDSIITLDIDLNGSYFYTMNAIFCKEYTVPSGNATYYVSGIYNDTLTSIQGCDSILVIDVTILQVDNTVTQNGLELTATATGADYQWFNCGTGVNVFGAVDQTFIPIYNGSYGVVVFQNGCYDTSICFTVNSADLLDEEMANIKIYPNPSSGIFNLEASELVGKDMKVFDLNGRLIEEIKIEKELTKIDLTEKQRGVYILRIEDLSIRIVLD
jgi:hypothetical protein